MNSTAIGQGLIATFFILFLISPNAGLRAEDNQQENIRENTKCMKCHGNDFYYYYNDWVERDVRERMNPYYVLDSANYYHSVHGSFKCVDCHALEYEEFPHPGYLRMEPLYSCLDCHGGDEEYARFHFEEIETEFLKSVHSSEHSEEFTCWMCHDPHAYELHARTEQNISEVVAYDNMICLDCHADINEYQLLTAQENPDLIEKHDWLPNQRQHFRSVRCIDCHAVVHDTLMVAHNVRPKDEAVKRCVECHQQNSLLMASLYRYRSKEKRNEAGFFNAVILNDSYVIGANRNYYLNLVSVVVFGMVFLGILVHAILRIIK